MAHGLTRTTLLIALALSAPLLSAAADPVPGSPDTTEPNPAIVSDEEQVNSGKKSENETEPAREVVTTSPAADEQRQIRNFRPSEKITVDNSVPYPVDI